MIGILDNVSPKMQRFFNDAAEFVELTTGQQVKVYITFIITKDQVHQEVCKVFGLTWEQITASGNHRKAAGARQVYAFLMKKYLDVFDWEIGEDINRYGSQALVARRKIEHYLATNDPIIDKLVQIEKNLTNGHIYERRTEALPRKKVGTEAERANAATRKTSRKPGKESVLSGSDR